jgi:hypothetical protein
MERVFIGSNLRGRHPPSRSSTIARSLLTTDRFTTDEAGHSGWSDAGAFLRRAGRSLLYIRDVVTSVLGLAIGDLAAGPLKNGAVFWTPAPVTMWMAPASHNLLFVLPGDATVIAGSGHPSEPGAPSLDCMPCVARPFLVSAERRTSTQLSDTTRRKTR